MRDRKDAGVSPSATVPAVYRGVAEEKYIWGKVGRENKIADRAGSSASAKRYLTL